MHMVYSLIRKSFGGKQSEPMLTLREKSLPEKFSQEEYQTHDATSSGQWAQHTTNQLFQSLNAIQI